MVLAAVVGANDGLGTWSCMSGEQVDTVVPQSQWNMDTADGNGPSGVNIDPMQRQIFTMEQEWLGVGCVTMGFIIARAAVFVHRFYHANLGGSLPYMTTPCLPVRYEIRSSAASLGADARVTQICSAVMSNGGNIVPEGAVFSCDTGISATKVNKSVMPVLALRNAHSHTRSTIEVVTLSFMCTTSGNCRYMLYVVHGEDADPAFSPSGSDSGSDSDSDSEG